jgi:hypothetical protein
LWNREDAARYALELYALAAEKNRAGFAGADKFAGRHFDEVVMIRPQADAAKLATLQRSLTAGELAQCAKAIGGSGKLSCTHNFRFQVRGCA